MPQLTPVDETFFTSAPQIFSHTWSIAQPADSVWAGLAGDRPLDWCRALNATWSSPRPFGVGTKRKVKVLGALTIHEHFFLWEEGHRYAFYVERANVPVFTSVAEDYVVEPDGPASCRFTWTLAFAPSALGRPGKPVNGLLVRSLFADTSKHFNSQ